MDRLRLRPLTTDDGSAFMAAHDELLADDFTFALGRRPEMTWSEYLEGLSANEQGQELEEGRVPMTLLVADVGGTIVGRVAIRHRLNEFLAREGGHIGYAVVPAHRRRGYATEILRQSLVVARSLGIDRILVTYDDTNVASATVIERGGGVLAGTVVASAGNRVRRYWID
jgi:predicted acetyltransferase